MGGGAGALVGAELEKAFAGGALFGRGELRPAGEGAQEGAFHADEGWRGGGSGPEGLGGGEKLLVFPDREVSGDEGLGGGGGDEEIEVGSFRADIEAEGADGGEAEAIEGGDEGLGEEGFRGGGAGAIGELVAAEFIELARGRMGVWRRLLWRGVDR